MSQVIKHDNGGTVAQPGATTPSQPQYTFKVNGNDYKTDEQSLRDKFNPWFSDLVQRGDAKERDRDKWVSSYNQMIDNVKGGHYELTSSNGQFYQGKYDGNATPESLGLNPDGSTARKSLVGNFIGRANKSNPQRISMLDHYFGNSIIGGYGDKQAADTKAATDAKTKADADAAAAKITAGENAKGVYQANQRGFGESQYGDNYRTSPLMVLGDQYWGANTSDAQRYQMMLNHNMKQYKQLYDTTNDANLDPDTLKKLKSQREMGMQYYDPSTSKFKVPLRSKSLGDFEQLSNPFGLASADSAFYNKGVYDKMAHPDGTPAADANTALKPLTQSGNLWTDGTTYFLDKDRKQLAQKWVNDENGKPRLFDDAGHPVDNDWHMENGNPDSGYTGFYKNGYLAGGNRSASVGIGQGYMNTMSGSPVNDDKLKQVQGNYSQIQQAYSKDRSSPSWLSATNNPETSDASYNVWARYQKAGMAPHMTSDETAKYSDVNGGSLQGKLNIQRYTSQHQNEYGVPKLFRMITLPDNRQFKGDIQTDHQGNVTGMVDENGKPVTDPGVINALRGVKYNSEATVTGAQAGNTDFSSTITGKPGAATPATNNIIQNVINDPTKTQFKEGGIVKAQGGSSINNATAFDNTASTAKAIPTPHEANVGDISRSMSDPSYHLSGSDKAELAALGLNLGSLAASFTGVGSEAAAGLGAVGTATQFGADVSREGLTWGNAGNALLGLGLDAASAIPGVGVWADSTKVGKTLAKTARFLVPALTAAGMAKAGATVYQLATGQKKVSDLSMDDLRDLVNGIHGVVGGTRYATAQLGSTRAMSSTIKLADGTAVPLDAAGELAIRNSEDPAAAAKSVVARLTGRSADDVQLDQKSARQWGLNPLATIKTWNKKVDNPAIIQQKGALIPKNIADYQGDGLGNSIMRGAINRTTSRMASANGGYVVDPKYKLGIDGNVSQADPGVQSNSSWNMFGDYVQGNQQRAIDASNGAIGTTDKGLAYRSAGANARNKMMNPILAAGDQKALPAHDPISSGQENIGPYEDAMSKTTGGDIPVTRRVFGSMFGMNKLEGERSVSYQQVRNRLQGLTGTTSSRAQLQSFLNEDTSNSPFSRSIQDQIKQAMQDPTSKGFVKFDKGGKLIPKHQFGNSIGGKLNAWNNNPDFMKDVSDVNSWGSDSEYTKPYDVTGLSKIPQFTDPTQVMDKLNGAIAGYAPSTSSTPSTPQGNMGVGMGVSTPGLRSISKPNFNVNPAMVSELGRAIASSNLNKQYDTRVERPMISAPLEVPISVHGNLFAQATANQQADNVVRGSQEFKTSDGTMQMLGNLEAQKQAGELRMQGAQQSNQTLQQTRSQALQSAIQNAQARMSAANENVHTNASATQAERQQTNLKRTMVAQPYLDFWQNADERAQQQYQQGRDIDTQISGIGEEQKVRQPLQQLSLAANNVWYDNTIPQEQKMARYTQYMNAISTIQSNLSRKMLQYRKDPYGTQAGTTQGYFEGVANISDLLGTQPTVSKQAAGGSLWRLQVAQTRSQSDINRASAKEDADADKSVMDDQTKKQLSAMKGINDLIKMALK